MKKLLTSLLLLLCCSLASGQTVFNDKPRITLHAIGGVETCEDNIKNLIANINGQFLKNASDFTNLKYQYVGPIKTKSQLKRYLKFICSDESVLSGLSCKTSFEEFFDKDGNTTSITNFVEREVKIDVMANSGVKHSSKDVQEFKQGAQSMLKIGLDVFKMGFTFKDVSYEYFIFCDPQTKRVVIDTVFNFPIYDYEL